MHIYWYQLFYCIRYLKQINLQISVITYYYTLLQKKQTFITENHFVTNISSFASYGKFQNPKASFSGGNRTTQIPHKNGILLPFYFYSLLLYVSSQWDVFQNLKDVSRNVLIFFKDFISTYIRDKVFFHYVCLLCFFHISS